MHNSYAIIRSYLPTYLLTYLFPNVLRDVKHVNLHTTKDFRATGKQSFEENRSCNLNGEKTILTLVFLQNVLHNS